MDGQLFFDQLYPITGGVTISKSKFVDEHKKLLHILKRGTKKQRLNEAKDQAKELAAIMKGSGVSCSSHSAVHPDSREAHVTQLTDAIYYLFTTFGVNDDPANDENWRNGMIPIMQYAEQHGFTNEDMADMIVSIGEVWRQEEEDEEEKEDPGVD